MSLAKPELERQETEVIEPPTQEELDKFKKDICAQSSY